MKRRRGAPQPASPVLPWAGEIATVCEDTVSSARECPIGRQPTRLPVRSNPTLQRAHPVKLYCRFACIVIASDTSVIGTGK
jgi:hypothetical protein